MSDAEAAIQAANITLWGAIVVGSLAMIGTIISAIVAPAMRARAEAKDRRENARIDALRTIVPNLMAQSIRMRFLSESRPVEAAELKAELARFDMWLTTDEWPVGLIAGGLIMSTRNDRTKEQRDAEAEVFNIASHLLPLWVRGDLSAAEAQSRYEKLTGTKLRPPYEKKLSEIVE